MSSKPKVKVKKVKKVKQARDYSAPPNGQQTSVFLENPDDDSSNKTTYNGNDSSSNPTECQYCHTAAPRLIGDRCCRKCGKSLLVCLRTACKAPRLPWDKFCSECGIESLPGDVKDDPRRQRSTPFLIPHDRVDCTFCSAMVANAFEDYRCRNCGKLRLRCPNEMCKAIGRFPNDLYCHRCGVNLSDPGGNLGITSGRQGQNQSSSCAVM
uniref:Uncharacterized protein n=1 Tax=Plectus sambesii TaxID=2011161 RepID=A0A914XC06_9BILA